jgi:serine/threonine-protein kinase
VKCGARLTSLDAVSLNETVILIPNSSGEGNGTQPGTPPQGLQELFREQLSVYHLESLLGAGAMGYVYLATHAQLGRKCAIKILSPRVVRHDEDYVARFHNEGRTTAALVHPNIVTTHSIGEHGGYHFLEMEFIAGRTLRELVDEEGKLTPLRATSLAAQIAEGLGYAHSEGIIHSDLKAENILLTPQGIPKLVDFGLAKQVQESEPGTTTKLIGTPHYMAPELFNGVAPNTQSDVYALGVCYFFMLTGQLPFSGETLTELRSSIVMQPIPSLRESAPGLSLEMAECLSLMMSKAPANRPRDGIEAAQLLRAVMGQSRDLESLLHEAFNGATDVAWKREGGGRYSIDLSLPDGRHQKLYLEPSSHRSADRLLLIYSTCCEVDPGYFRDALCMNAELLHGAIAIREIDGQEYFVMVDTYPRATVDPEEIRRSVLEVGFQADEVEKRLTGIDRH